MRGDKVEFVAKRRELGFVPMTMAKGKDAFILLDLKSVSVQLKMMLCREASEDSSTYCVYRLRHACGSRLKNCMIELLK